MSSRAPKPTPTAEELLDAAWSDEIADRLEALDRGEFQTVSAREVFEHLRARL